jgi:hypothetical protein
MAGSHIRQCRTHAPASRISDSPPRNAVWVCSIRRTTVLACTGTVSPLIEEPDGRARHKSA